MVYATHGLIEALLGFAREAEPSDVTIQLATTPAAALPGDDLDPEVPVFTEFYFPGAGESVSAVFGMDLGTPAGQTDGRFVSHSQGRLALGRTDDLHAVVFVAIPPWDLDSLAVFSRDGKRQPLDLVESAVEHDEPWDGYRE